MKTHRNIARLSGTQEVDGFIPGQDAEIILYRLPLLKGEPVQPQLNECILGDIFRDCGILYKTLDKIKDHRIISVEETFKSLLIYTFSAQVRKESVIRIFVILSHLFQ